MHNSAHKLATAYSYTTSSAHSAICASAVGSGVAWIPHFLNEKHMLAGTWQFAIEQRAKQLHDPKFNQWSMSFTHLWSCLQKYIPGSVLQSQWMFDTAILTIKVTKPVSNSLHDLVITSCRSWRSFGDAFWQYLLRTAWQATFHSVVRSLSGSLCLHLLPIQWWSLHFWLRPLLLLGNMRTIAVTRAICVWPHQHLQAGSGCCICVQSMPDVHLLELSKSV